MSPFVKLSALVIIVPKFDRTRSILTRHITDVASALMTATDKNLLKLV